MKIKFILLLFVITLLSGCTVNYNLTINGNNTFDEEFIVNAKLGVDGDESSLLEEYKREYPVSNDKEYRYYDPYTKVNNVKYYEKEYNKTSNGYIFSYKTNYSLSEIQKSRTIYTAFKNFRSGYNSEDKYYYLYTDYYLYNSLAKVDSLIVNITLNDCEVVFNNANKVDGNTYTWIINKDNNMIVLNYVPLKIDISETQIDNPSEEDEVKTFVNDNKGLVYTIVIIGVGLIILIIILISSKIKLF